MEFRIREAGEPFEDGQRIRLAGRTGVITDADHSFKGVHWDDANDADDDLIELEAFPELEVTDVPEPRSALTPAWKKKIRDNLKPCKIIHPDGGGYSICEHNEFFAWLDQV